MTQFGWNETVRVHAFDSAASQPMVLCEVPRDDGKVTRLAVPRDVYEFARSFDGVKSLDELLIGHDGPMASKPRAHVERLVASCLVPRGLITRGQHASPRATTTTTSRYLIFKIPILPARVVSPIARALAHAFSPTCAVLTVITAIAAQAWYFLAVRPATALTASNLVGHDALAIMLVVSLGSLIHEFGHAAAAARYGCRETTIGWGLYVYFSVLFTDLSETWRLPRLQRAVVDLGGVYFQLLYASALIVLLAATHARNLSYAVLFTDLAIAMYLSPFLRLDGYWLLSDLFGIANLRQQARSLVRDAFVSLVSRQPLHLEGRWKLQQRAARTLAAYATLSTIFFGGMWFVVLRGFGLGLLVQYPATVRNLVHLLSSAPVAWVSIASALFELFWRSIGLFGMTLFLFSGVRGVLFVARWLVKGTATMRPVPTPM